MHESHFTLSRASECLEAMCLLNDPTPLETLQHGVKTISTCTDMLADTVYTVHIQYMYHYIKRQVNGL